jgi:hypothetical protein
LGAGLLAAALACLPISAIAQEKSTTAAPPAVVSARTLSFDNNAALAAWTLTGDVTIDLTKSRAGPGGSLKLGPNSKALLRLRDDDASGKVELWVYDDGARPENAKVSRAGPRWGLVQSDGRVLAVGILYASYLGGAEGYTATACEGKDWFEQLFWLGVNRAPAAWHKWTFDFDAEDGLRVLHNDKEIPAVDSSKTHLKGFNEIAIWGDSGPGDAQTVWVDKVSFTLGGPVKVVAPPSEADPYDEKSIAADTAMRRPIVIYSQADAPQTSKLDDLPLKQSLSQYGITWTFEQPARVGQFVNGDWYIVGPVTVKAIEPRPLYGAEIPRRELDGMDKERPEGQRVRNGFMLNPPAQMKVAYDSGVRNYFDPSLIQKLPVVMRPGDSLVSTISMPRGLVLHAQLRNKIERGEGDSSPIRAAGRGSPGLLRSPAEELPRSRPPS